MPADDVLVTVDRTLAVPAHAQLERGLRDAIRSGRLRGGTEVPPTRRLAEELGVSRGVVVEAYQQLTAEGYLVSRTGGYTRVAEGVDISSPRVGGRSETTGASTRAAIDLTYGRPDVSQFPRSAWLRSLRTVLTAMPHDRLSYLDGRGAVELRQALADYLGRVRGTWIHPDGVIVTNGYAQAIGLVLPALTARGIHTLAVEDPSDRDANALARSLGFEVVDIPVDHDGIDVTALDASAARAVIVTPAHQFPTGAVLSAEKRAQLVAWARGVDGYIVEDDYDAEYRYDSMPVGAVQGLAPERVLYAGTASKTLAPGLRLGWLAAPADLVDDLAARKFVVDRGSPVLEQLTFADFLTSGEFDRHLRRMRVIYRRRRDALVAEMAERLPDLNVTGIAAGLHSYVVLPDDLDESAVIDTCRANGLLIEGASIYRVQRAGPGALILGYGKLDEPGIMRAVEVLARSMHEVRRAATSDRADDADQTQ